MEGAELPTWLECSGCGLLLPQDASNPFRCPAMRRGDGIDHVVVRRIQPTLSVAISRGSGLEDNPFIRYRDRLHSYHQALAHGFSDHQFVEMARAIDERVAEVDGRGFRTTPLLRADELARRVGLGPSGTLWVKDETGNVAGSHKARHLMGILLHLLAAKQAAARPLAIASCGNAALAAAVLARAVEWPLQVYIPPDAEPSVVTRLEALGARMIHCPRQPGERGDPCLLRFREAIDRGAVPFTCQGPENGLAIEGGETLAYELLEALAKQGRQLDRLVVQVGGGALASACVQALEEALGAARLPRMPKIHAVQTQGGYPLVRAWEQLLEHAGDAGSSVEEQVRYAAAHRDFFMRPWESEPHSVAHGILDDETYDWLAVVRGMLESGGRPVVVDEPLLLEANRIGRETTGIPADPTGTAGLAGLMALLRAGEIERDESVAVLFTGVDRTL